MKKINDEFGHNEGDQALRDIATLLKNTFRVSDSIARMGGDEFIVLITEPHSSTIEKTVSQHIHDNLRIHNEQAEKGYKLAVSMGMAHYDPERPCSPEELLARADELMYQHKLHKHRSGPIEEIPSSKGGKSNHREYERHKTDNNSTAELVLSGSTTIRNISPGGILVRTSQRLTKNTIYTIKTFDDNNEELSSKGRVVWSSLIRKGAEKDETEPCYEAGLQFIGGGLLSDGSKSREPPPPRTVK
jgi:diguanylate cyclase (GGDEF)-like protein